MDGRHRREPDHVRRDATLGVHPEVVVLERGEDLLVGGDATGRALARHHVELGERLEIEHLVTGRRQERRV